MSDESKPEDPTWRDSPSRIAAWQWRQIVNSALDTAIITTDCDSRVTSWNEGAHRLLGWSERDMLGKTLACIFTSEDQASGILEQEIEHARLFGRGGGVEGWRMCKDGSRIWAAGDLSPVRSAAGSVVGFVKILRDQSAYRRAEDEFREEREKLSIQVRERTESLRTQEEQLRHSQKMQAVGHLTGGVAHDFNNLLQIIIANLEIIRRCGSADPKRLKSAAEVAMSGARRAAILTQKLLAFARRQPLSPRTVDVNEVMLGMSEILHRMLDETISVVVVPGGSLWQIETDATELESAILNLAVNARDAMPTGGTVAIETANAVLDDDYALQHGEVTPGQYVLISVSDTGVGMDAQTLSRAFEPFFTTKPIGKGTGLGLSQVNGFVKQSGGHVALCSEVGHGTTVKMYLPRLRGSSTTP